MSGLFLTKKINKLIKKSISQGLVEIFCFLAIIPVGMFSKKISMTMEHGGSTDLQIQVDFGAKLAPAKKKF